MNGLLVILVFGSLPKALTWHKYSSALAFFVRWLLIVSERTSLHVTKNLWALWWIWNTCIYLDSRFVDGENTFSQTGPILECCVQIGRWVIAMHRHHLTGKLYPPPDSATGRRPSSVRLKSSRAVVSLMIPGRSKWGCLTSWAGDVTCKVPRG